MRTEQSRRVEDRGISDHPQMQLEKTQAFEKDATDGQNKAGKIMDSMQPEKKAERSTPKSNQCKIEKCMTSRSCINKSKKKKGCTSRRKC